MKKKKLLALIGSICLMLVLALLPFMGACVKPAPAPAPTPAPAPAPTPAPAPAPAPVKPIEMKLATHTPPRQYANVMLEQWIKKVDERTEGKVKITLYPGQTLGKIPDEWDMLKTGVCDIAWILPMFYPGVFPLVDLFDLPFMVPGGRPLPVLNGLFDKFNYKEFTEVKVLWPGYMGPVPLHMVKKPVRTLEELKGMQIRTPPGVIQQSVKALGATPAMVPPGELYTALERGMVDGCTIAMEAVKGYKLYEVTKYHTIAGSGYGMLGYGMNVTAMNLETWNSLPPDIQKIFDELSPWAQELLNDAANADDEDAISLCKEAGNTFIYLSPEEEASWIEATKSVVDDWAAEIDAKGLPGTAIVEEAHRLTAGK